MTNDCVNIIRISYMFVICVSLLCILAVSVYLCDFAATARFKLAFVLQDFNKRIRVHRLCKAGGRERQTCRLRTFSALNSG